MAFVPELVREALFIAAPATKPALQVHQVLCLPRHLQDRQPRASGDRARRCWSGRLPSAVPATKATRPAAARQQRPRRAGREGGEMIA